MTAPSRLDALLEQFVPEGDADAACTALAEQLRAAGLQGHVPRTLRAFGISSVFAGDGEHDLHVLVHTGDEASLRTAAERFFGTPSPGTQPRILWTRPLPADIAFLLSDDLLADLERRLAAENQPDLRTRPDQVASVVAALRPRVEAAADLSLTGDLATVTEHIDQIVQRLRTVGPDVAMPDDALTPMRLLIVLGLIATEAVRDELGCGALVGSSYAGVTPLHHLGDVSGFPAIATGNAVSNIAQKVLKHYRNGREDAVAFMARMVVQQFRQHPPEHPRPRDDTPDEPATPEELEELLWSRASYAPFAGFLAVAMADGEVEDHESLAFFEAAKEGAHPLLMAMVGRGDDPMVRIRTLHGDPDLTARSLAAAGVLIAREVDPDAARDAFLAPLRAVAMAHGRLRDDEARALEAIERHLDGGLAKAQEGGLDHGLAAYQRRIEAAANAPWAAFLLVAHADGTIDPEEVQAFTVAFETSPDPLLQLVFRATTRPAAEVTAELLSDPTGGRRAIRELGMLFREHPQGVAAQGSFIALLERVATVKGAMGIRERAAVEEVQKLLEQGTTQGGCLVYSGLFVLAPLVFAWQLAAPAFDLVHLFVPVATGIEVVVLTFVLAMTRHTNGYGGQVVLGTVTALFACLPIALTSVLVGWFVFPEAAAASGGVLAGAVGGFLGTLFTGVVWSALAGWVLRRRGGPPGR